MWLLVAPSFSPSLAKSLADEAGVNVLLLTNAAFAADPEVNKAEGAGDREMSGEDGAQLQQVRMRMGVVVHVQHKYATHVVAGSGEKMRMTTKVQKTVVLLGLGADLHL